MPNNVAHYQKLIEMTRYYPYDGATDKIGGYLELGPGRHWITGLRVYTRTAIKCHPHAIISNDGSGPTINSVGTTSEVQVSGGLWTGNERLWNHDHQGEGRSLSECIFDRMNVQTTVGWRLNSTHRCKFRDINAACRGPVYFFDTTHQSNANIIEDGNLQASASAAIVLHHGVANVISCRIEAFLPSAEPAILLGQRSRFTKIRDVYMENLNRPHAVAGSGSALIEGCYAAHGTTSGPTVDLGDWTGANNLGFV